MRSGLLGVRMSVWLMYSGLVSKLRRTDAGLNVLATLLGRVFGSQGFYRAAARYGDNTFARENLALADGNNAFTVVAADSAGEVLVDQSHLSVVSVASAIGVVVEGQEFGESDQGG